jgi:hypothetical protein
VVETALAKWETTSNSTAQRLYIAHACACCSNNIIIQKVIHVKNKRLPVWCTKVALRARLVSH